MSSVLRALRKLEQETYEASGMPGGPALNSGRGRYPINPLRRHRILLALVFLALILTGFLAISLGRTWLFHSGLSDDGPVKMAVIDSDLSRVPPDAPARHPDTVASPSGAAEPKERDTRATPDPTGGGVFSEVAAEIPDLMLTENASDTVPIDSGSDVNEKTEEERPAKIDMAISETLRSAADPEFPELAPSAGLTLQAISWSSDPARRLAVINGRLCREGENVEGVVLVQINPEDVLISHGRMRAKLVFKIR